MQRHFKGNILGASAILLWSTLATFGVLAGDIPPFQLTSMAFFVAFLIGLLLWKKEGKGVMVHFKQPLIVWIVGVCGLFGYHFFYFLAIQNAPAIEANLINYLWPLLIVLFSALLPNEKLRWFHIVGAFLGFLGAFTLISKGGGVDFDVTYIKGYMYAVICGIVWASYSVASRYFGRVPTSAVGAFCGVTAVFSLACHLIFETTQTPSFTQLLAVIGLGLGPVGGAFFVWDYGVKNGDIQLLGSLSYAAPLLSTLLLIALGLSVMSIYVWIACGLIIAGSMLSSLNHFIKLFSTRNQRL
jgi:drug/metabolite transporter (DMT)-like permease